MSLQEELSLITTNLEKSKVHLKDDILVNSIVDDIIQNKFSSSPFELKENIRDYLKAVLEGRKGEVESPFG